MLRPNARRFNLGIVAFSAAICLAGLGALALLERADRLPAPPLTATHCIDEKFKFLRETDIRNPDIIAVGSSVTWRNIDFSLFDRRLGDRADPLNAAPCFLKVNETAFLTDFYLRHMPRVRTVVTVFAMRDFDDCRGDGAFFDADDARRYVFDRMPGWPLYFKNFRPWTFAKDVVRVPAMRSGADSLAPMVMDRYGSGPLRIEPPDVRGDMAYTRACLDRLEKAARDLKARKVDWVVVLMPPMPAWIAAFDLGGRRDAAWRAAVAARLDGTGALLLDGARSPIDADRQFTDPTHLHWDSVPILTTWIMDEMERAAVLPRPDLGVADAL
jgi:hypothetical protein